jgi:nucleotide-binding universal stress UspA family protein
MEERILVPLNGSETGEAIIPKLEELVLRTTPRMDAEVTLIQVISKMNYSMLTNSDGAQLPIGDDEFTQLTQKAQEYLESVAEKMRTKGIVVKTRVALGHTAEEIVKAAHEIDAHLIAMSTHGTNGIVRWAIGSVTDKVMRLEGKIPVLAVRATDKAERNPVLAMGSLQSLVKHS